MDSFQKCDCWHMNQLRTILQSIEGRGYKAYKKIEGQYHFPKFRLIIDHAQGDPFADPSRVRIQVAPEVAGFPIIYRHSPVRRNALEDFLGRTAAQAIRQNSKGVRGSGKSGQILISTSGQWILKRNAILIQKDGALEARLQIGLPADGRRILARQAEAIFFEELPAIVEKSFLLKSLDTIKLECHIHSVEDQDHLRRCLADNHWVAFIADGSLLPRQTGIDDRPMSEGVVPFVSPDSLAREVDLPNVGRIRGMAIPTGVTLIVGGGFHGKSTLLHALERGIYNHIPDDGREQVVCTPGAVKIRSEDGRSVTDIDISPFINNLPGDRDTTHFTTGNASGSTSQAANIIEALCCGSQTLLIDEDSSATNFMIRDKRMQALVCDDKEPITPLLHRIRELHTKHNISTVLVMGGSGDYFSVADTVIMMDAYVPRDVTVEARRLAALPEAGIPEHAFPPFDITGNSPLSQADLDAKRAGKLKIEARTVGQLIYGVHEIDLGRVEQLVERGQTRTIGYLIRYYAKHFWNKSPSLEVGLQWTLDEVEKKGLDILTPWITGNLALPRLYELTAAIHRLRYRGGRIVS